MSAYTLFPEFELDTPEKAKRAGMELAGRSAEKLCPGWLDQVADFAINWFAENQIEYFQIEDLRKASEGNIPRPRDLRSWGNVPGRLKKLGLIRANRLSTRKDPIAHGAHITEWRVI